MTILESVIQWLMGTSQFVIGIIVGTVITGVFTWKVVLPKVLANPEVSRFLKTIEQLEDYAERIVRNQEGDVENEREKREASTE